MPPTEYRFTPDELRSVARFLAEELRTELTKTPDAVRLKVPALAKEIGVGRARIRDAIRAGHYGTIFNGNGRDLFYATLEEARAYHFEGKSKKKTITSGKRLSPLKNV